VTRRLSIRFALGWTAFGFLAGGILEAWFGVHL
jgi:hypothetical protein